MAQSKRSAKTKPPERRKKQTGTVDRRLSPDGIYSYRAKKRKKDHRTLLGEWRSTWDLAFADLPSLTWEPKPTGKPSLQKFILDQLTGGRSSEVAYTSYKRDEIWFRTRVAKTDLGVKPLDTITTDDIQRWIDQQRFKIRFEPERDEKGRCVWEGKPGKRRLVGSYVMTDQKLSAATRKQMIIFLRVYFEKARRSPYRHIKLNPVVDIDIGRTPKNVAKPMKALSVKNVLGIEGQLLKFKTTLDSQGDRLRAMIMTQLETGLRKGELLALRWYQVQVSRAVGKKGETEYTLLVDSARSRSEGGDITTGTKRGAIRMVSIRKEIFDLMMAQPRRSDYVFTTRTGKPVGLGNYNRDFNKFTAAIGLSGVTTHYLRHTFATLAAKTRSDRADVQQILGHSSGKMLDQVYGHSLPETAMQIPHKIQEFLQEQKELQAEQEETR